MKTEKSSKGATAFEMMLGKCYCYANKENVTFPKEYRVLYESITEGIEDMGCAENVRSVMRMRYRYGLTFTNIAQLMGVTYQWVYELHKTGVSLLEKHLSV